MVKHFVLTTLLIAGLASSLPAYAEPCVADEHENDSSSEETRTYSSYIELSEVYPAPSSDEEEFIELYNSGDSAEDLSGWMLTDASNKTYTLTEEDFLTTVIDAGDYFVIPHSISKIYLNNGGDTVSLHTPDGTKLDSTTYESADSGLSWNFADGEWNWSTSVTEAAENEVSTAETTTDESDSEEDTSDNTENSTSESTIEQETSEFILISELLPNPSGLDTTDEWIELVNTGTETVQLDGWKLTDESNYYTISNLLIEPGEYVVFEVTDTKISLNNSGDSLFLIDPFNTIVHGTAYEDPDEGIAWAYIDSTWEWTDQLTPGEENIASTDTENSTETSIGAADDANGINNTGDAEFDAADTDVVSIELFRSVEDSTTATVSGVVTVLPGTFGTQYFYIQDDSAGIQIYSHQKTFPDLAIGDRIQVTGEKSTARGETRIKVTAIEQIVVLDSGHIVVARDTSLLDESLEGILVQVEGEVVESSSKEALIDDLIQIVLKKHANIDADLLEEGTNKTILGIVTQYDEDYRVQPRSDEDIQDADGDQIAFIEPAEAAGTTNPDSFESTQENDNSSAIAIAILILAAAGGIGWTRYKAYQEQVQSGKTGMQKNQSQKRSSAKAPKTDTPPSIFEQFRNQLK